MYADNFDRKHLTQDQILAVERITDLELYLNDAASLLAQDRKVNRAETYEIHPSTPADGSWGIQIVHKNIHGFTKTYDAAVIMTAQEQGLDVGLNIKGLDHKLALASRYEYFYGADKTNEALGGVFQDTFQLLTSKMPADFFHIDMEKDGRYTVYAQPTRTKEAFQRKADATTLYPRARAQQTRQQAQQQQQRQPQKPAQSTASAWQNLRGAASRFTHVFN